MDSNRAISLVFLVSFVQTSISFSTVAAAGQSNISIDRKKTTQFKREDLVKSFPMMSIEARQDNVWFDGSSVSSTASSQASCEPAESVIPGTHKRLFPEAFDESVDGGYRKQLREESSGAVHKPNSGGSTSVAADCSRNDSGRKKNLYLIDPSVELSDWKDLPKLAYDENSPLFDMNKSPPPEVFNEFADEIDLNQPPAEHLSWREILEPAYDENNPSRGTNKQPSPEAFNEFEKLHTAPLTEQLRLVSDFLGV